MDTITADALTLELVSALHDAGVPPRFDISYRQSSDGRHFRVELHLPLAMSMRYMPPPMASCTDAIRAALKTVRMDGFAAEYRRAAGKATEYQGRD